MRSPDARVATRRWGTSPATSTVACTPAGNRAAASPAAPGRTPCASDSCRRARWLRGSGRHRRRTTTTRRCRRLRRESSAPRSARARTAPAARGCTGNRTVATPRSGCAETPSDATSPRRSPAHTGSRWRRCRSSPPARRPSTCCGPTAMSEKRGRQTPPPPVSAGRWACRASRLRSPRRRSRGSRHRQWSASSAARGPTSASCRCGCWRADGCRARPCPPPPRGSRGPPADSRRSCSTAG